MFWRLFVDARMPVLSPSMCLSRCDLWLTACKATGLTRLPPSWGLTLPGVVPRQCQPQEGGVVHVDHVSHLT